MTAAAASRNAAGTSGEHCAKLCNEHVAKLLHASAMLDPPIPSQVSSASRLYAHKAFLQELHQK
jgi:hypothetical protein